MSRMLSVGCGCRKEIIRATGWDHDQPERDGRWFPQVRRPRARTMSRYGSVRAVHETVTEDQWRALVSVSQNLK